MSLPELTDEEEAMWDRLADPEPVEDPYDVMAADDHAPADTRPRSSHAARRPPRRPRVRQRPPTPVENYYPHVHAWVEGFLAPTYAHELGHGESWRWCSKWWNHAEALVRLEAAWRAWEVLRLDPGVGASVWLQQHGDPCMAVLTDRDGPFSHCSADKHKGAPPLPTDPPPAGLFPVALPQPAGRGR